MIRLSYRCYSKAAPGAYIVPSKPAIGSKYHDGKHTFDSLMPKNIRRKAWEISGESKDKYFRERFSHVHAAKIQWKKDNPDLVVERKFIPRREHLEVEQRRHRAKQNFRDRSYRNERTSPTQGLKPSPLSEYIYGTSSVLAALKANKRDYFSRLLVHNPDNKSADILALAKALEVKVVFLESKNSLNILTNNAVHNGYVLETKPLIPDTVSRLGTCSEKGKYQIVKDFYGTEVIENAYVARKFENDGERETENEVETERNKFPLGIYLDQVTDPHNMGAIIRSAHFLGADFIVLSEKNCAPLSPVVSKTSVGAVEFVPIYSTLDAAKFFDKSREAGWVFVSATSPTIESENKSSNSKIVADIKNKEFDVKNLSTILDFSPMMLVLGSEGTGIRTTLKLKSDYIVQLGQGRSIAEPIIDSLNVSVAAAMLVGKALGK